MTKAFRKVLLQILFKKQSTSALKLNMRMSSVDLMPAIIFNKNYIRKADELDDDTPATDEDFELVKRMQEAWWRSYIQTFRLYQPIRLQPKAAMYLTL